jgi:hypothetical protein
MTENTKVIAVLDEIRYQLADMVIEPRDESGMRKRCMVLLSSIGLVLTSYTGKKTDLLAGARKGREDVHDPADSYG